MSLVLKWAQEGISREEIQKRLDELKEWKRDGVTWEIKSVSSSSVQSPTTDITTRPWEMQVAQQPNYAPSTSQISVTPTPEQPWFMDRLGSFKDEIDTWVSNMVWSLEQYKDKDQLTWKNVWLDTVAAVWGIWEMLLNPLDTAKWIGTLVAGWIWKAAGIENENTQVLDEVYNRWIKPFQDAVKYTASWILPDNFTPDEWKLVNNENFRKQVQNKPVQTLTTLLTLVKWAAGAAQKATQVAGKASWAVWASKIANQIDKVAKSADIITKNKWLDRAADIDQNIASGILNAPWKAIKWASWYVSWLSRDTVKAITEQNPELKKVQETENFLENKIKEQSGNIQSKLEDTRNRLEAQKTDEVLLSWAERRKAVLDFARTNPSLQLDITTKSNKAIIDNTYERLKQSDQDFNNQLQDIQNEKLTLESKLAESGKQDLLWTTQGVSSKISELVPNVKPEAKKADIDTKSIRQKLREDYKTIDEDKKTFEVEKKAELKSLWTQLREIDNTIKNVKKTGNKDIDSINTEKVKEIKVIKNELDNLNKNVVNQNTAQFKAQKEELIRQYETKKQEIESTYSDKLKEETAPIAKLEQNRSRLTELISGLPKLEKWVNIRQQWAELANTLSSKLAQTRRELESLNKTQQPNSKEILNKRAELEKYASELEKLNNEKVDYSGVKNISDRTSKILSTINWEKTTPISEIKETPKTIEAPKTISEKIKESTKPEVKQDEKVTNMKNELIQKELTTLEKRKTELLKDKTIDRNSSIFKNLDTEINNKKAELETTSKPEIDKTKNSIKIDEKRLEYYNKDLIDDINDAKRRIATQGIDNVNSWTKQDLEKNEIKLKNREEFLKNIDENYNKLTDKDRKLLNEYKEKYELIRGKTTQWDRKLQGIERSLNHKYNSLSYIGQRFSALIEGKVIDVDFNLASEDVMWKIGEVKWRMGKFKDDMNLSSNKKPIIDTKKWEKEEFDGTNPRFGTSSWRNWFMDYDKAVEVVRKYLNEDEYEVIPVAKKNVGWVTNKQYGVIWLRDGKVWIGTPEHEVVHAYINRFIDSDKYNSILDEVIANKKITQAEVDAYNKKAQEWTKDSTMKTWTKDLRKYAEEALADGFIYYIENRKWLKWLSTKVIEFFKDILWKSTDKQVRQLYKDIIDMKRETDLLPESTLARQIEKLKTNIPKETNSEIVTKLKSELLDKEFKLNDLKTKDGKVYDDVSLLFNINDIQSQIKMYKELLDQAKETGKTWAIKELQDELDDLNNQLITEKKWIKSKSPIENKVAKQIVKKDNSEAVNRIKELEKSLSNSKKKLEEIQGKKLPDTRPIDKLIKIWEEKTKKLDSKIWNIDKSKRQLEEDISKDINLDNKKRQEDVDKFISISEKKNKLTNAQKIVQEIMGRKPIKSTEIPSQNVPLNKDALSKIERDLTKTITNEKNLSITEVDNELKRILSEKKNIETQTIDDSKIKDTEENYNKRIEEKKIAYNETVEWLTSERNSIKNKISELSKKTTTPEIKNKIDTLRQKEKQLIELESLVSKFNKNSENLARQSEQKAKMLPKETWADIVKKAITQEEKTVRNKLSELTNKEKTIAINKKNLSKEEKAIKDIEPEEIKINLDDLPDIKKKEIEWTVTDLFKRKFDWDNYTKKDFFKEIQRINDSYSDIYIDWKNYIKNNPTINERFPEAKQLFEDYAKSKEFERYFDLNSVQFKKERNAENDKRFKTIFRELAWDKEADQLEKMLELDTAKRQIKSMDERVDSTFWRAFWADKVSLKILEGIGEYNASLPGKLQNKIKNLIIKSAPITRPLYQEIERQEDEKKKKKLNKEEYDETQKILNEMRKSWFIK